MELQNVCNCNPEDIAAKLGDLPELPTAATEVLRMIDTDDSNATSIARAISLDQALTARILRIANSSFYGLSRQIKTLQDAVVILGAKVLRNLVVAMALKGMHHKFDTLERNLWEESVGYACGARFIAMRSNKSNPEEAFLAGLLCNIGELICNNKDTSRYRDLLDEEVNTRLSRNEIAINMFGYSFSQSGAVILDTWNMAPEISICTLFACEPDNTVNLSNELKNLIQSVYLGRTMGRYLGIGNNVRQGVELGPTFSKAEYACNEDEIHSLLNEFNEFFKTNKQEILYA